MCYYRKLQIKRYTLHVSPILIVCPYFGKFNERLQIKLVQK